MNRQLTRRDTTLVLVECAIMIALATVLSVLAIANLPYGGSITIASMLPLAILSYRNGLWVGLGASAVYGVLQQLLGLSNLSYFTTWQSIVAIILLDYIIAFAVIGLAGIFRRLLPQRNALLAGCGLACLLRYLCHVISGATVWAGLSIPTEAALAYSFIYNATYMVPETIVLLAVAFYLGSVLDFSRDVPKRIMQGNRVVARGWYGLGAALSLVALLVVDTALVFPYLQDMETGKFTLAYLKDAPWVSLAVISALLLACALTLLLLKKRKSENT